MGRPIGKGRRAAALAALLSAMAWTSHAAATPGGGKKSAPKQAVKTTPAPKAAEQSAGSDQKGETDQKGEKDQSLFNLQKTDDPTYINASSLSLDSKNRTFVYTGNVEVTQGDMTLTSEFLEGNYDESNKIQRLTARKNVVITKGPTIRATSNRAVYEATTGVVTLLENPQLYQEGSVLTADRVKVYLQENRSTAEGQVRMKLVKAPAAKTPEPAKQGKR